MSSRLHKFDSGRVDTGICQYRETPDGKVCGQKWDHVAHKPVAAPLVVEEVTCVKCGRERGDEYSQLAPCDVDRYCVFPAAIPATKMPTDVCDFFVPAQQCTLKIGHEGIHRSIDVFQLEPGDFCALAGDCQRCIQPANCTCSHHAPTTPTTQATDGPQVTTVPDHSPASSPETNYCPSCHMFSVNPHHCDNCGGRLVYRSADSYSPNYGAPLPESSSEPAPEGSPTTGDVCEHCGQDFGLSGKDNNGYNSTCVHCGNNTYTPTTGEGVGIAGQCRVTCQDFSMCDCDEPHQCVLDNGHPFDPLYGEIHRFVTHMMPVAAREVITDKEKRNEESS